MQLFGASTAGLMMPGGLKELMKSLETESPVSRGQWATTRPRDLFGRALFQLNRVASTSPTAASELAVLTAWLARDTDQHDVAGKQYRLAIQYAERAEDPLLQLYMAGMMSNWACDRRDGKRALRLVNSAESLLPRNAPPIARSWLLTRKALALSATRDAAGALNAIGQAEEMTTEPSWPWEHPLDEGTFARCWGTVNTRLGLSKEAIPILSRSLELLGRQPTKTHAIVRGDLAEAYLRAGQIDEACRQAAGVFVIGWELGCTRFTGQVRKLRGRMTRYEETQAVRDLDELMRSA